MAQSSFAIMTNLGRAKEAAALANGTSVVITHIAIGNGATVPSGGETALYNEVDRKAVSGHGTVVGSSNVAYFDIFLSASDGPYTIREAGLYDSAGDLIAIAHYDPPISKPVPSSGQTVEGTVRLEVAFSDVANVTIVVDPAFKIPLQRLNRLPWVPVLSMTVASPPASPVVGDIYLVPAGATGAWSGQDGKIAEFTSAGWGIISPPNGHGISLPDGRVFERISGSYVEKIGLDVQSGKWSYAAAAWGSNTLSATLSPAISALTSGMQVRLKVNNPNTGAASLNLNSLGAIPIVYGQTGAALNGGDWVAGEVIALIYDGTNWRLNPTLALMDKRYAKLPAPPSNTFYVFGPTGSDSNSGLANTAADGFATIQGAIDAISSRYMVVGTVTINVANGSYNGFSVRPSFVSSWRITGNDPTPGGVTVNATTTGVNQGRGVVAYDTLVTISGMTFNSYYGNVSATGNGRINMSNCNLTMPVSGGTAAVGAYGGRINISGRININGSGSGVFVASQSGSINVGYSDDDTSSPVTLIYNAATFTAAGTVSGSGASISFITGVITMQGSATGKRYSATGNGTISVSGAGANYLPGSEAGTTSTGGQYL